MRKKNLMEQKIDLLVRENGIGYCEWPENGQDGFGRNG